MFKKTHNGVFFFLRNNSEVGAALIAHFPRLVSVIFKLSLVLEVFAKQFFLLLQVARNVCARRRLLIHFRLDVLFRATYGLTAGRPAGRCG